MRQHRNQKYHKLNAINFDRDTHPEAAMDGIASLIEDFSDLLQNTKQRKLKMAETYGKRKKPRKMMYCLAEAQRRCKQSLFASTSQASIMQDGAASQLFARFTCCTKVVQRYTGHLGIHDHKTADSLALAQSMVSIVTDARTEWFGVPFESEECTKDQRESERECA